MSYLLALALCFSAHFAIAQSTSQAYESSTQQSTTGGKQLRSPDVVYVPTPSEAVDAMLKVAKVGKDDVVYDLGSGDGRIPIMAVQKYNAARAIGIRINVLNALEYYVELGPLNLELLKGFYCPPLLVFFTSYT